MDLKAKLMARDDQTTTDQVARAAHENVKFVYEYFYKTFGRDSYDGRGAKLVST
ncbi:MAG: hypothetical protein GTN53_04890, partial [Candidatus Aminicenantes bacterium]|nr:hypothetical protein [Candidatus Aminicenantes bacterium]NIQ65836.1 hypothetical protein [Candidatus Aminicenantes bacterium]NIT21823.1 hypothetical protein [Candidatus Aminicenantes bacterium]